MLVEETFFKLKWIVAKNELANSDKRGSQTYQKPMSGSILDIHARASGIHTGLVAAKTDSIIEWLKNINIDLFLVDKWTVDIDNEKLPSIGINWNEYQAQPMSDTVNCVYEFLYKHKTRRPTVFSKDFWYFESIIDHKIETVSQLDKNDVLILSFPFFGDFQIKKNINELLDICVTKEIPVLLDCVWLPLIKDIIKIEQADCIEVITHSMTKTLPLAGIKGGIVFKRKPIVWQEKMYPLGNKLGSWLFSKYINELGYNYVSTSLRPLQKKWCELLDLDVHDMAYIGKCKGNTYLQKYSLHNGKSDLISLVPFYENDKMLSLFLKDNHV
tara:strand:+ start:1415 stop:2398 length:984 start_codon:yes stop_codon:yes gene_type:complete